MKKTCICQTDLKYVDDYIDIFNDNRYITNFQINSVWMKFHVNILPCKI